MDESFGDALHQLRTEHGLSLRDLGTAAHLSKSYVENLEKGRRQPTRETAAVLSKAGAGAGYFDGESGRILCPKFMICR